MTLLAGLVVVAFGLFLVGLGGLVFARPDRAQRFLESFASSARAHYTEQLLRLAAGVALVRFSPRMHRPELFELFGWVIAGTAALLLLVPWRWHHAFGRWVIPMAVRRMKLFGIAALLLGTLVLAGASRAVLP